MKSALAGGTAKRAAPAAQAPAAGARPALPTGMSDEVIKKLFEPGSFTEVPHDGMRKTIARRLAEAKATIPHFYLSLDCRLDALLMAARGDQCGRAEGQGRQARLQAFGQ